MTQRERVRQASREIIKIFDGLELVEQMVIGLQMLGTAVAVKAIREGKPIQPLIATLKEQLETTALNFHTKAKATLL